MENLHPRIGDRVRVRQRAWVVQEVEAYEHCRVLTLSGHTHDGDTRVCRVLHPFDDVDTMFVARRTKAVSMRAWNRACATLLRDHGDAASLRTAATAHLELLPYQLEPALAMVSGYGSRLLIADEVGLGKTVQALLCAAELGARGICSRILVICPAGLRDQWVEEARARVGLPLSLVDQAALRRIASRLPAGVNPWGTVSGVVSSIDFIKRPDVLPAVVAAAWDMVIVDEAHGACGQSDRHHAVASLARRTPFVVLLSATPHNGEESAFANLCDLGKLDDNLVVFRRSRLEVGRDSGRRVHTVRVAPTAPERRMHAALAAFTRAVRLERPEMDRQVWLLLSLLHKRALSSPHALAASAERRLQLLDTGPAGAAAQLLLPLDDEGGELDGTDTAPMWHEPALQDAARERRLLQQVVEAGRQAEGTEGKLHRLHRLLRRIHEPVIVFTEYRDTLQHVRAQVAPHAVVIHGGMTREQRRAALEAFPSAGVLLATDAAGEGLNLQHHCRCVVNLELPWNPMRLEQRIGRVDRIGQRRRVHVFHLVADDTGETRLLDRLSARVSHAVARVGAPDPLRGRPAWTEDASARLVVLQNDDAVPPGPLLARMPVVPLTRLQPEGEQEAVRLARARSLAQAHSMAAPRSERQCAVLTARTRRPRFRSLLGQRTLIVCRTRITDVAGRAVGTHVSAVLAPGGADLAVVTRLLEEHAAADPAQALWRQESLDIHGRLTAVRVRRARAIAALFGGADDESQPGLFDAREERRWKERAAERLAARSLAEDRAARIAASGHVSVGTAEAVLILECGS